MEFNVLLDEGGDEPEVVAVALSQIVLHLYSGLVGCIKEVTGQELILQELIVCALVNQDLGVGWAGEVLDKVGGVIACTSLD